MKFWEAMKAMEEGSRVRAKSWQPQCFIALSQHTQSQAMGLLYWTDAKDEWEFFQEPETTFPNVIKGLLRGKKFKRKDWVLGYISNEDGLFNHTNAVLLEDFLANDWVEVKQ